MWALCCVLLAQAVVPQAKAQDRAAGDQDDLCIWIHPTDPKLSAVIGSDKQTGKIFVYDTAGKTIQTLSKLGMPGNIDVRYGFPLGGKKVDLVAVNERLSNKILVFVVDPSTRRLTRVDDDRIKTGENYGFALYRSRKNGKFFGLTTSKTGNTEQVELKDDGAGRVAATQVRRWKIGLAEGAVFDDEAATLFVAEETRGVWKLGAEPEDPAPGEIVFKAGERGTAADFEGIAIYHLPNGEGYILLSSQGNSTFAVLDRKAPHAFLGTFTVKGATETDGLDVTNASLGGAFERGCLVSHDGGAGLLLVRWEDVAAPLKLRVDTTWNPRE